MIGTRRYVRGDKAWYANANKIRTPEVSVGLDDEEDRGTYGGTYSEFFVRWIPGIGPRIECFGDGATILATFFLDLVLYLGDHKDVSAEAFEVWAKSVGIIDKTEREQPPRLMAR